MKKYSILFVVILLFACMPNIKEFNIPNSNEGSPVTFTAVIDPNGCSILQTNVMTKRLLPEPTEYGQPQVLIRTVNTFTASVQGYTFGYYEGLLSVPYRWGYSISGTVKDSARFIVDAPEYIFHFDRQQKKAGWTFSGVFDPQNMNQISNCDFSSYPGWAANVNWPVPDNPVDVQNGHGSIFVFIHSPCFPTQSSASSNGMWKYNLISPSIEQKEQWQTMKGFKAHFMSNVPGIKVQPLVKVRKLDSNETFFRPIDSNNNPIFIDISPTGQWVEISFAIPQQALATVAKFLFIQLNVFGNIATINGPQGGPEGLNNLDFVSPIY